MPAGVVPACVLPAVFLAVAFSAAAFRTVAFATGALREAAAVFFAGVLRAAGFSVAAEAGCFFAGVFFGAGAGGSVCRRSAGCSGDGPLDSGRGVTGEASWTRGRVDQVGSAEASRCSAAIGTGSQSGRCRAS
ncbi:hypothetical protein BIU87_19405 [Streptomyces sp. ZS0098]|nr:hypothetical protein BIU87_19405 [Streptomyces sp. ZS0098]